MPETPITTTTNDSSGQVSYSEFAAKIRAKYPKSQLYKSKPDKELVEAWIQAKPERSVYVKKIKGYDPLGEKPGSVPLQLPQHRASIGGSKSTTQMVDTSKIKKESALVDSTGAALPGAGGMIGGTLGGTPGATMGGALGAGAQDIMKRVVMGDDDISTKQAVMHMVGEGVKQGALDYGGKKVGEGFFYLLNKIPHAVIKNGIRFLPSELNGGKITKYVEDLLSNLVPSAETMAKAKASGNASVIGAADKLAKGFSRFRGTTEEMGKLLQDTYRTFELNARKSLEVLEATLKKKGIKPMTNVAYRDAAIDYTKNFKNELANKIAKTNKPELIGGFLRATSSLAETRNMVALLEKEASKVINATRTRLLQDTLQEALTGSIDPISKGMQKIDTIFSGNKFKQALDKIGEDKLKAIYGDIRYKNIVEFSELVKHFGTGGGTGVGKFLNLIFLLGPIRSGLTIASGKKIAVEGLLFNRAAKIITDTQGIRLTENFVRATTANSVKAISLARDELKAYSERADQEYIQEQRDLEDQYYKDHPDEVKYRDINKPKEN